MADIEWPGGKANPPQGTADSFHVRVVTLHESPFIIVSDLDPETGFCPGNQGAICDWGFEEFVDDGVIKLASSSIQC
ncbi:unnamed protein product [Toxocara canis]|uniref:TsaA-like domain-containing protein n=1 Tax=Toxocara canis TaxID=6265 RepID=A0A183U877_TOXCA|nr:unnamed protein product [Toxocara canis]